jgi:8-oxo-dGTP diphosphatase
VSVPPIRAAGGVLWRRAPDDVGAVEVAVIHRPRYDDWSLPKGKLAAGESELDAAVREILEETGFHVRVGRSLGVTRYAKETEDGTRPKVVRWWAMRAEAGGFTPTGEVDELVWLAPSEAAERLSRSTDVEVLERFAAGPD